MTAPSPKPVAVWLAVITLLVACITVFGGLVRLTGSGLSMVDWNVIMGVLPPLNEVEWHAAFDAYKQSPEYQKLNKGMEMPRFQFIFLMEWGHRVLARSIGLVVLIPFIIFKIQKRLTPKATLHIIGLFCLGGMQGVVGWIMVKSGLVHDPYVSHYRLTLHLSLALAIMGWSLWLCLRHAFAARSSVEPCPKEPQLSSYMNGLVFLTFLQLCLGGMVAGSRAGYLANTFPLIEGELIPPHIWGHVPWYTNFTENLFLLNFMHRWAGVGLALLLIMFAVGTWRRLPQSYTRKGLVLVVFMVLIQVLLGIMTLLNHVPITLGSLHQGFGVLLWASVVYAKFCVSGAPCRPLT